MPAASAVSDRMTLDVRGAVLNCRQRTFGVPLPHPSRPQPSPERLSVTKVLRASNFRCNSVRGSNATSSSSMRADEPRNGKRGMVLTVLKNIEKLPDPVLGNYHEKVSNESTIWRQKSCNNGRATTSRTSAERLATILPSSPKFRINISHASRKLKTTAEDCHTVRPRNYIHMQFIFI